MHPILSHDNPFLVVEESNVLLHEDDTQLFGCLIDSTVILTTTGGRDILSSGSVCAVDIVYEGELSDDVSRLFNVR